VECMYRNEAGTTSSVDGYHHPTQLHPRTAHRTSTHTRVCVYTPATNATARSRWQQRHHLATLVDGGFGSPLLQAVEHTRTQAAQRPSHPETHHTTWQHKSTHLADTVLGQAVVGHKTPNAHRAPGARLAPAEAATVLPRLEPVPQAVGAGLGGGNRGTQGQHGPHKCGATHGEDGRAWWRAERGDCVGDCLQREGGHVSRWGVVVTENV
jgi:hypothetical protein